MNEDITIHALTSSTPNDLNTIASLLETLSPKFDDTVVDESLLATIIESPYHDILVARDGTTIIGIACLSVVIGIGAGKSTYLEDFVVAPTARGKGVGSKLWVEIINWCQARGTSLRFTSNKLKVEAHQFYAKHGATIRDTDFFEYYPK